MKNFCIFLELFFLISCSLFINNYSKKIELSSFGERTKCFDIYQKRYVQLDFKSSHPLHLIITQFNQGEEEEIYNKNKVKKYNNLIPLKDINQFCFKWKNDSNNKIDIEYELKWHSL